MEEVIVASPDSPSAQKLNAKIRKQSRACRELMKKYAISEEEQIRLRNAKSKLSKH
jgi:hypothetical protein